MAGHGGPLADRDGPPAGHDWRDATAAPPGYECILYCLPLQLNRYSEDQHIKQVGR